ncbi:MAG TPA: glycerophosphodiester phosphodiesterase [Candidatus Deferrimicrobiaceae bacterium]
MRPSLPGGIPGTPVFVAHRGASDRALENSLSAFSLALADGADMIEFDVRLTSDGVPVVFHDERTGRTAKANLEVAGTTAARLRKALLKNAEPIPALAEVLDLVRGRVPLNVESKAPGCAAAAGKALAEARYRGAILLSSGLREECLAARALMPGLPCGLVTRRPSMSDLAFCLRHGLSSIHPDHRFLTVLRVRKVLSAGIPLLPYTVDDPDVALRLIDAGAAGVFSNRAQSLREFWRNRPAV